MEEDVEVCLGCCYVTCSVETVAVTSVQVGLVKVTILVEKHLNQVLNHIWISKPDRQHKRSILLMTYRTHINPLLQYQPHQFLTFPNIDQRLLSDNLTPSRGSTTYRLIVNPSCMKHLVHEKVETTFTRIVISSQIDLKSIV